MGATYLVVGETVKRKVELDEGAHWVFVHSQHEKSRVQAAARAQH